MKILLLAMLAVATFPLHAFCADRTDTASTPARIRLVFDTREVVVSMFDTPASRDFLSLLPLQAEFRDFAGEEKIASLPRRLDATASSVPDEPRSDFTYYKPWGNLAVFYRGFGTEGQLVMLGRIESGKNHLASMDAPFSARIERIE